MQGFKLASEQPYKPDSLSKALLKTIRQSSVEQKGAAYIVFGTPSSFGSIIARAIATT